MPTVLDWSRFNTGPVGPERAFEAFTAQLFERWLRREHGPQVESYALHGAGGDGGVEAFATLDDGTVIGFQAKWFQGNLNSSRASQIRRSVDTACTSYANLQRYIVALPRNLTRGTPGKGKGGVERWTEMVTGAVAAHPNLTVTRWDETGLLDQLAAPGNQELKALWFEGELTLDRIRLAWERSQARLGQRYFPDLHAIGCFEEVITSDLWSHDWVALASLEVQRYVSTLEQSRAVLADFQQLTAGRRDPELDEALHKAQQAVEALIVHAHALASALRRGPEAELPQPPSGADTLWRLGHLLVRFKRERGDYHAGSLCGDAVAAASEAQELLARLDQAVREAGNPRLVVGPAGCGKTHAAAHTVHDIVDSRRPAVFLQARGAGPASGVAQLLRDALDVPGWPLARILDGLEALAVLVETEPAAPGHTGGFARVLVVLDGLEESPGWTAWTGPLSDLVVEVARRPRLHVLVTARPETVRRMEIPKGFSYLFLEEHGDVDLPDLLKRYSARYRVDVQPVPWLGWALRTPLEVRMLAEEYQGREITAGDGATTNLLSLFRRKLLRLEQEARQRAGGHAWSEHLGLVSAVLQSLSDLTAEANAPYVVDAPLIRRLEDMDREFTAERVRLLLGVLVDHGLVDTWWQPAPGLRLPRLEYGLATRHISDFIIAQQAVESVLAALAQGKRAPFPPVLRWRSASAVLFVAMLVEHGHFATDDIWEARPKDLEYLMASALGFVAPALAAPRHGQIRELLTRSTATNREVLDRLVVPVARIPKHPLGPPLLDEAPSALPLAQRDPIWSVPDDLPEAGPWQGNSSDVLESLRLAPEVDRWNGLPLVLAWTCSSAVEERRRRAREALAVWGSRRLDEMVLLLDHMARVDDPQVVEDIVVAALGAVLGAKPDDRALVKLARLVDELFFAEDARAWTPSVVVRVAARGIVERAALIFSDEVDALLARARPPYAPRGDVWPPIDVLEVRKHSQSGGIVVTGDLSWYVADRCFSTFAEPATDAHHIQEDRIDYALQRAIEEGRLEAPPRIATAIRSEREAERHDQQKDHQDHAELIEALRGLHRDSMRAAGAEPHELDERALLKWAVEALRHAENAGGRDRPDLTQPRYSDEFAALLQHAAEVTGVDRPSPAAVRDGMIASIVRGWGWSEDRFSHYAWDMPSEVVDDAIAKRYGAGASHGSRSAVCRFREKYVWAAVNQVAGELADRLPVWSKERHAWVRLSTLDGLGNGPPDPLPRSVEGEGTDVGQQNAWTPEEILPELFVDEPELARRAERWLVDADLPDPGAFVRGAVEGWDDAAVLALSHYRWGHQSCIDQLVQVRAFAARPEDLELLRRDAPFLGGRPSECGAWVEGRGYVSPALACWAPWLNWRGEDQGHASFDTEGNVRRIGLLSVVGSITARFEGEWPQEPSVWMPSPKLGRALGVVAMRGGRYLRHYIEKMGTPVAIERDLPAKSLSFDHHYLALDRSGGGATVTELRELGESRTMVSEELPPGVHVAKVDLAPTDFDGVRKPGIEVIVDVANATGNPDAAFPGYEIAERIRRRWRPEHLFITLRVIDTHGGSAKRPAP